MNSPTEASRHQHKDIYAHTGTALAAGLLRTNLRLVIACYGLLSIPHLITWWLVSPSVSVAFSLRVTERILELITLYLITRAVFSSLLQTKNSIPFVSHSILFFALGISFWLLRMAPQSVTPWELLWALPYAISNSVIGLMVCIGILSSVVGYFIFFWFVPFLLNNNEQSWADRFGVVRFFTQSDLWLPLKVIIPAVAVSSLLQLLLRAPYPDGRDAILSLGVALTAPLEWLIMVCLSLGFILQRLPDQVWRAAGFDAYRAARLSTLTIQAPRSLSALWEIKTAFQIVAICCLLWVANTLRLSHMPPAASISLQKSEQNNGQLEISLAVSDPRYSFRGFEPSFFRIADASGAVVARAPIAVAVDNTALEDLRVFPRDGQQHEMTLIFSMPQTNEKVTLWYGGVIVGTIDAETTMDHSAIQ